MSATLIQPNPFTRDDTFLGVCQAIGDDFGINPIWLRLAFGLPLIWSPTGVILAYLGVGAVVLLSRVIFPVPRRKTARVAAAQAAEPKAPVADNEPLAEVLAVAA